MAFFDDIGKKISNASQSAVQKTKDITDIARCNSIISDEEKRIQNLYMQIGKLYATIHRTDCEKDFAGMISSITESENKISELKAQIQTIKGITFCEHCGAEVSENAAFCSACGTPMPKAEVTPSNGSMINCSNCGQLISSELRFCLYCGKPVANNTAPTAPETDETVHMINCKNCGQSISDELKFCLYCGKPVAEETTETAEAVAIPVPVVAPVPVVPVVPVAPAVPVAPITVVNEEVPPVEDTPIVTTEEEPIAEEVQNEPVEETVQEAVPAEVNTYCTGCGAALSPENRFCINCGKPVEEVAPVEPASVEVPVQEPVVEEVIVPAEEPTPITPIEEPVVEEVNVPVVQETVPTEVTTYCTGCGAALSPENRFCINCGKPVEEVAPVEPASVEVPVQEPVVEEVNIPVEQPQSIENLCANCGKPLADGVKFCIYCGTPTSAPTAQPAAPALKKCPNCGNECAPDMLFCTECGTKL